MAGSVLSNQYTSFAIIPIKNMKQNARSIHINLASLHMKELILQFLFIRAVKTVLGTFLLLSLAACATAPANHKEDNWFGKDKYAHFLISGITSAAIAKAAKEDGKENCDAAMIGFGITLSLGAAKESYDKRYKKTLYSSQDMVWNLAGSTIGSLAGSNCH